MNVKLCLLELKRVQELILQVREDLKLAPSGRLWVSRPKDYNPRFYRAIQDQKHEGRFVGEYLKKSDPLIPELAQKEYNQKVLKRLLIQEDALSDFLKFYDEKLMDSVYESISPPKRKYITPYRIPDEEFITQWKKEHSNCKFENSYPKEHAFQTRSGDLVRSKSEMIFSDRLFFNNIINLYEAPLILPNGRIVYPDFTMLNLRTRQTKYAELFCMMSDADYSEKMVEKLKVYSDNGIFVGNQLFCLYESQKTGIDTNQIDFYIQHYLM